MRVGSGFVVPLISAMKAANVPKEFVRGSLSVVRWKVEATYEPNAPNCHLCHFLDLAVTLLIATNDNLDAVYDGTCDDLGRVA